MSGLVSRFWQNGKEWSVFGLVTGKQRSHLQGLWESWERVDSGFYESNGGRVILWVSPFLEYKRMGGNFGKQKVGEGVLYHCCFPEAQGKIQQCQSSGGRTCVCLTASCHCLPLTISLLRSGLLIPAKWIPQLKVAAATKWWYPPSDCQTSDSSGLGVPQECARKNTGMQSFT